MSPTGMTVPSVSINQSAEDRLRIHKLNAADELERAQKKVDEGKEDALKDIRKDVFGVGRVYGHGVNQDFLRDIGATKHFTLEGYNTNIWGTMIDGSSSKIARKSYSDFYSNIDRNIFEDLGITADNIGTFDVNDKEFQKKYGDTTIFHYGCDVGQIQMS